VRSNEFAGFLFASTERIEKPGDVFVSNAIECQGPLEGTRWMRFRYRTSSALLNEQWENAEATFELDSPFEYPLFVRLSEAGHILVLAQKRHIVEHALERERVDRANLDIRRRAVPIHRVRVAIHRLVTGIARTSSPYALTRIDANLPVGEALKFVVLYGEDIGQSGTFRKIQGALRFYACGIKRRNAKAEQLHIDSQGRVRCVRPDSDNPRPIDGLLRHLHENGFLKTDRDLWEAP
jgi:hypothetical protein